MAVELSRRQKRCLRTYGWRILSPRETKDDRGKLFLESSSSTRKKSLSFRRNAEAARYKETPYRSRVVAKAVGIRYIFAVSAREPFSQESHVWTASGKNLGDLVRFLNRVINPVLFGISLPDNHKEGVGYAVVDVRRFDPGVHQ